MHQNNCLPLKSLWLSCFLGKVVFHASDIVECLTSHSPVWNHIIFPVSERDGFLCCGCYLDISLREPLIGSPYLWTIEYIGYCFFLDFISSDIVRWRGEVSIFAFWYLVHESLSSSDFFFLSGSGMSHVISVNDLGAVYHHVDFRQVPVAIADRGVEVTMDSIVRAFLPISTLLSAHRRRSPLSSICIVAGNLSDISPILVWIFWSAVLKSKFLSAIESSKGFMLFA